MSDKNGIREKIEQEIASAQAKLVEFKAQLHTDASGGRAENAARLDVLHQRIEEAKFRLLESNRPPESVQEQIVD